MKLYEGDAHGRYPARRVTADHEIVLAIQKLMDGAIWGANTLDRIAAILQRNGYVIRDADAA